MSSRLSIRAATEADADALWALLRPVFRAGDTYAVEPGIGRREALAYWTGAPRGPLPGTAFLAEEDGQPAGTFYLRPNARGGGAHVANAGFVTARAAQGRGVGRAMLHAAEREARQRGFLAMQFNFVVATNTRALHIWQSAGYEAVGRLPRAFRHPREGLVDAVLLYKSLESSP